MPEGNIRYNILSRGIDKPEKVPVVGELVTLRVQQYVGRPHENNPIGEVTEAALLPEHIEFLFVSFAVRVLGRALVEGTEAGELPAVARYETERFYPEGRLIGELVLKKE